MAANLAPELILEVFQFLPLKSLFTARAVNKLWHTLVAMTDMTPERRALYDLYFTALTSPVFLASRAYVLPSLVPFNRPDYIARFEQPTGTLLPHEFRCWVLEWPEKAVFGWSWPGLDSNFNMDEAAWRPYGSNCIGMPLPATLQPRRLSGKDPNEEPIMFHGLQIWYYGCVSHIWLVVDDSKPLLHGTLHWVDDCTVADTEAQQVAVGWVSWLKAALDKSDRKYSESLAAKDSEV